MKTEIIKQDEENYILIVVPEKSQMSINFVATKLDLYEVYIKLKQMFKDVQRSE